MKAGKLIAYLVSAVLALVVSLVGLVFFVNREDEPPSAAAQRFERLLAARPAVAAAENAYVYALGFNVPRSDDPVEVGARRMDWIISFGTTGTPSQPDPAGVREPFADSASAEALRLKEACSEEDRLACAREFRATAPAWRPNNSEELALRRYRQMLALRAWREVVPLDLSAPLPPYGDVIQAQRLYAMQLLQWARAGQLDEVRTALDTEFEHWRAAQTAAQTLIPKMIAVAALRNHFFFATVLLGELPRESFARVMPAGWEREFSRQELSMELVMAGEYAFVRHLCVLTRDGRHSPVGSDEERGPLAKWIKARLLGLVQVQAMANVYAERQARLVESFAVPTERYALAEQSFLAYLQTEDRSSSLHNPARAFFLDQDDGTGNLDYPFRVASLEGMRRGALLTLQLRAAHADPARMPAALAATPLHDPLTGKAFEWNAETRSILFPVPEKHFWRRIEYFY
jgi:hypothetical protein